MNKSILMTACAMLLPLMAWAQEQAPVDAKAAADRAQAVLQQAREALGGEANLKAIQSLTASGEYKTGAGQRPITGQIKFDLLLPDKYLKTLSVSPNQMMQLTTLEAVNGPDAWADRKVSSGPMGGGDGFGGGGFGGGGAGGGGADAIGGGGGGGGGGFGGGGGGRGGGRGGGGGGFGGPAPGTGAGRMPELDPQMQAQMQARARTDYLRLSTAWLLAAPGGAALEFAYDKELNTDKGKADAVRVAGANDFVMWLIFDQASHRPAVILYREAARARRPSNDAEEAAREAQKPQLIDMQLYLSDYKQVNNVWLPHQIVKASNGQAIEEWKLKYKVNPNLKPKQFEKPKKN